MFRYLVKAQEYSVVYLRYPVDEFDMSRSELLMVSRFSHASSMFLGSDTPGTPVISMDFPLPLPLRKSSTLILAVLRRCRSKDFQGCRIEGMSRCDERKVRLVESAVSMALATRRQSHLSGHWSHGLNSPAARNSEHVIFQEYKKFGWVWRTPAHPSRKRGPEDRQCLVVWWHGGILLLFQI